MERSLHCRIPCICARTTANICQRGVCRHSRGTRQVSTKLLETFILDMRQSQSRSLFIQDITDAFSNLKSEISLFGALKVSLISLSSKSGLGGTFGWSVGRFLHWNGTLCLWNSKSNMEIVLDVDWCGNHYCVLCHVIATHVLGGNWTCRRVARCLWILQTILWRLRMQLHARRTWW